ncbi:hypothetical protein F5Y13DRAFT_187311 [Hypoxylon sp. FL1857]|nr:hypothetical protein F5Y13DRAFT_187311 [Hypoxylon sp. FL1857]
MDGTPNFFSYSPRGGEHYGYELFDSQDMKDHSDNCQDAPYISDSNDSPPDVPPLEAHSSHTVMMCSDRVPSSSRPAKHHTRYQSQISISSSTQSESLGLAGGSSESPETCSSQPTITPEEAPASTGNKFNGAPGTGGFLATVPPPKRRKQLEQEVNGIFEGRPEVIKRNKFLERNRVAATKCRQKKKEWVSDLEEAQLGLESQHNQLQVEYSNLRNEITNIKSQLMEHATCNDPNIDKWIENEAKRFVLGASERYDQMLTDLGHSPRTINRQGNIPSASGYPAVADSELASPMTPSQRGKTTAPVSTEEVYPTDVLATPMPEDVTSFEGVSMANNTLQASAIPRS